MATIDEARQAIIDQVAAVAPRTSYAGLVALAEALAWVSNPAQPHGGQAAGSK